jgi:hypothetical protein
MSTNHGVQRHAYALITPSYAPDFQRCRVLTESVRRHAAEGIDHYIIVDRCDEHLFASLRGPRTHLVVTQDILPWWLYQIPFFPKWWLNLKGMPGRGWIIQQIIKLSVDVITSADVCILLDSDVFLVKPFDPRAAERDGKVPMFREILPAEHRHNTMWHEAAGRLLGLPLEQSYRTSYVTSPVTWLRANVIKLHHHIERTTGRGWIESLCSLKTMSEYVLYGVFCERVLREEAGHYLDDTISTLNYWDTKQLDDRALCALRNRLRPEHMGVMISGKSNTEAQSIRNVFDVGA